jgi:hypothetical protein
VFVIHLAEDRVAVEALARELCARGIDARVDQWTIAPGDDPFAKIDDGLSRAEAGLVVFSSAHARGSAWGSADVGYLMFARIEAGRALIPVEIGDDAWVPSLLRPLVRRGVEAIDDAIAAVLLSRRHTGGPPR